MIWNDRCRIHIILTEIRTMFIMRYISLQDVCNDTIAVFDVEKIAHSITAVTIVDTTVAMYGAAAAHFVVNFIVTAIALATDSHTVGIILTLFVITRASTRTYFGMALTIIEKVTTSATLTLHSPIIIEEG